jgi:methyl-accepting chemotaxis protein
MDGVTQQNAALVEQAAAAAHSMEQQAEHLSKLVDVFTLADNHKATTPSAARAIRLR